MKDTSNYSIVSRDKNIIVMISLPVEPNKVTLALQTRVKFKDGNRGFPHLDCLIKQIQTLIKVASQPSSPRSAGYTREVRHTIEYGSAQAQVMCKRRSESLSYRTPCNKTLPACIFNS